MNDLSRIPVYTDMEISYVSHMGSDINIVNAARVSFAKEVEEFSEKDFALLKYLAKHNHWSPFAHTSISLRCKAPIFLARQLVKHQVGGTWNEESRRYIDSDPEFYPPRSFRKKAENKKQGSGEEFESWSQSFWKIELDDHIDSCLFRYISAIEEGMCPEQARFFLPLNTMTNWIWTGSVAFFARVFNQRTEEGAQEEAREFAEKMGEVVRYYYPDSWLVLTGRH